MKRLILISAHLSLAVGGFAHENRVDEIIDNHVILCTGPSLHRKELLEWTNEQDFRLIPFKKIFIATNDPEILDLEFEHCPIEIELIEERGHQLDCLNSIIMTIQSAIRDPQTSDDDIIIFKHESVHINDMFLVKKAIEKLTQGWNVVARMWTPDHFYMTNVFYIKASAARVLFDSLDYVESFSEDAKFCEDFFTKYIIDMIPNVYSIGYDHLTRKDNELGFYHIPFTPEDSSRSYWDKSNYFQLYQD